MRRRFIPLLLLLPTLSLWSCSTSDTNPIVDFGEGEGITYREVNNFPVGPHDYTDWTTDATWNKQERALFADVNVDLNGAQRTALFGETTVYPNPTRSGRAKWSVWPRNGSSGSAGPFTVRGVLVNRQYQSMVRFGPLPLTANGLSAEFSYTQAGLSPRELYRLYYVVTDASGLVYKGHGDVRYDPQ
ncbi:hypothetical protein Q5H92_01110 [Hymenobacter sp. M29]|uniref:Lipoprotein n=1 Tax=Hymenobacter mellowenesis TaxID=3063995 RepID=A0ABT9A6F3_9BACT|nr:hypothetical protein [Hymenobacter sp. M29]MDO7844939.1 hypothetical protein [Hymenobacter sp. M29]